MLAYPALVHIRSNPFYDARCLITNAGRKPRPFDVLANG
jgi:hypothetical protein